MPQDIIDEEQHQINEYETLEKMFNAQNSTDKISDSVFIVNKFNLDFDENVNEVDLIGNSKSTSLQRVMTGNNDYQKKIRDKALKIESEKISKKIIKLLKELRKIFP